MRRSARLNLVYAAPFNGLYTELAGRVKGWAPSMSKPNGPAIDAVGVNALLGKWTTSSLYAPRTHLLDERYLAECADAYQPN